MTKDPYNPPNAALNVERTTSRPALVWIIAIVLIPLFSLSLLAIVDLLYGKFPRERGPFGSTQLIVLQALIGMNATVGMVATIRLFLMHRGAVVNWLIAFGFSVVSLFASYLIDSSKEDITVSGMYVFYSLYIPASLLLLMYTERLHGTRTLK